MTTKIFMIALIVVPYILRELTHWVTQLGQPKGKRVGGVVSVCIWIPSHLVLLVLAVHAVVTEPISWLGWIGYAIYCLAILLRILSFQALRTFYSPDVVIRDGHRVIE